MVMEEKNQTKTPKCPTSSVISQDATPHGIGALSPYSIAECLQDMMHLPAVKHLCFFLVIRREKKNQTSGTSLLEQSGIFFPAVLPVETWWLFFRDVVHMGRSRTRWRRVWGGSGWISSPLLSAAFSSAHALAKLFQELGRRKGVLRAGEEVLRKGKPAGRQKDS